MATAKKLPSGSWRCQVFSHIEEIPLSDGTIKKKRVYKSFTCSSPVIRIFMKILYSLVLAKNVVFSMVSAISN